jgi:hypothetical protein
MPVIYWKPQKPGDDSKCRKTGFLLCASAVTEIGSANTMDKEWNFNKIIDSSSIIRGDNIDRN